MSNKGEATVGPWALTNFGDGLREDGLDGYAISRDDIDGDEDYGFRIYLRDGDPLAHAAEIVTALNEYEARKVAGQEAPADERQ